MIRFALSLITVVWTVAVYAAEPLLQRGDLLFVVGGRSAFSDAIVSATGHVGLSFDHVAILDVDSCGAYRVIEATPGRGVTVTQWADFVDNAPDGIVVKRVVDYDCEAAICMATSLLGKPYDICFDATNDSYYCSELVQKCYVDQAGEPLFPSIAMNFLDSDGNMPQFWIDLYDGLGIPVPQGQPGTNPNSISSSSLLSAVTVIASEPQKHIVTGITTGQ